MHDARLYHSIYLQKGRCLLMKQKSLKQKTQLLQNLLSCCLTNVKENFFENIQACRIELDQFYDLKSKKSDVSEKAKWIEKGEKKH